MAVDGDRTDVQQPADARGADGGDEVRGGVDDLSPELPPAPSRQRGRRSGRRWCAVDGAANGLGVEQVTRDQLHAEATEEGGVGTGADEGRTRSSRRTSCSAT